MNRFLAALALAGAFFVAPAAGQTPVKCPLHLVVAGDSHGVQVAKLLGCRSFAKDGASIRDLPAQLTRVPIGSDVLVFAGTNDANPDLLEDPLPYAEASADVALLRGLRIAWAGPSYLARQNWRLKAVLLDERLDAALRPPLIHYQSMNPSLPQDDCSKDGVHLKDYCYRAFAAQLRRLLD